VFSIKKISILPV